MQGIIQNMDANTLYNIVTIKNINPYTFILDALERFQKIDELWIATYRICEQALVNLMHLLKTGKIGKVFILINDNYKTLMKDKAMLLPKIAETTEGFSYCVKNNHAKVTLMKVGEKKIVIQGSGNYAANSRIEQYCLIDNEELYDFHLDWIKGIDKWVNH